MNAIENGGRLPAGIGEEADEEVEAAELALGVGGRCLSFLSPLLRRLDDHLDRRLVRTLANTVVAVIRNRNRPFALMLSELGAILAGPRHAPTGTKRLGNLLHSKRWRAEDIDEYLLEEGRARVEREAALAPEGRALCILDGSVLEKPESIKAEGLSPIRSSKARRLSRPRPKLGKGYYRGKPGGPIVVPGYSWVGVLVAGWASPLEHRPLTLGAWHWYAKPRPTTESDPEAQPPKTEGPEKSTASEETNPEEDDVVRQKAQEAAREVLNRVVGVWGADRLLHVWDRGLSGAAWLGEVLDKKWRFVVRWKKGNKLRPTQAQSVGNPQVSAYRREQEGVKAWKLTAGLRAWGEEKIANPRNPKQPIKISFAARKVHLLTRDDPLWLVVVRLGKSTNRRRGSNEPWRLLTNTPVENREQCWRIVQAYASRWQVEQMLRFGKCELGVESIRVRAWEARHKLLAIAALAYSFLIQLLNDGPSRLLEAVLRFAHRTGRQSHDTWRHLYRLRAALAYLWQQHTPYLQGAP